MSRNDFYLAKPKSSSEPRGQKASGQASMSDGVFVSDVSDGFQEIPNKSMYLLIKLN